MSWGGAALALVGVLAWGLVLVAPDPRRTLYRTVVEGLAAHAVVSTLVAVALVSAGIFRVTAAQALAAAVPLLLLLRSRGLSGVELRSAPLITRLEAITLLLLVLVSPIALPRMALLYMDSDAGAYSNRAIHHLHEGSLSGTIPVRDQLQGELLKSFDRDNLGKRGQYRPGIYRMPSDPNRFIFQFFPGWPMLLAQWAGLFGLARMFDAVLFTFVMAVLFCGFVLEDRGLGVTAFTTTMALIASSPLLLYFSKYTTTEIFLLFLFLFVLYFFSRKDRLGLALASLGVLAWVVTHVSSFLYAPLFFLVALHAYRAADRRSAAFAAAAFVILLAGIPLGLGFSPSYVLRTYRVSFISLPLGYTGRIPLALVTLAYVAGLGLSLGALWHARTRGLPTTSSELDVSRRRSLQRGVVRAVLLVIAAWTVYRGYLLGWTDHFVPLRDLGGIWGARAEYAGAGWAALAHANIVNMLMATSVVGLGLVLALALWRGDGVCSSPRGAFLLAAVLLPLGIYTFLRFDTPVNYYASRYFLPVFVPATMLLYGELLAAFRVRRAWILGLALVGLGFNLPFDRALYLCPGYPDEMRFVEDVAARVGDGRVLFARNLWRRNLAIRRLLTIPLEQAHRIPLVSVVGRKGGSADRLIEQYARQLNLRDAAVLSLDPPDDGRAFAAVTLFRRRLLTGRFYPFTCAEGAQRYYLYDVDFD